MSVPIVPYREICQILVQDMVGTGVVFNTPAPYDPSLVLIMQVMQISLYVSNLQKEFSKETPKGRNIAPASVCSKTHSPSVSELAAFIHGCTSFTICFTGLRIWYYGMVVYASLA